MRRHQAKKRDIIPDRKYGNVLISKFINTVMLDGKKGKAEEIVYKALESVEKEVNTDILTLFNKIIENTSPKRHVALRRFGGNTYSVPREIPEDQRPLKAIKLIVLSMREIAWNEGKQSYKVLSDLLLQCYNGLGPVVAAKEKLHKTAEANAAFSHFQW